MSYHSDYMSDEQIDLLIGTVERNAYNNKIDNCRVTMIRCSECARLYEEELETAKAKIVSRVKLLCIECDPQANESSGVTTEAPKSGINIRITWELM